MWANKSPSLKDQAPKIIISSKIACDFMKNSGKFPLNSFLPGNCYFLFMSAFLIVMIFLISKSVLLKSLT